jgi:hypothetical protein
MAVIATDYPESVRIALANKDEQELAYALHQVQSVVEIGFNPQMVERTIAEFGWCWATSKRGASPPPSG